MVRKRLDEIETMMDEAVVRKEHLEIKKLKHGIGKHTESAVRLKLVGTEVLDGDPQS